MSVKTEAGGMFLIKMAKVMLGDTEACKVEDASCKAYIDTGCSNLKAYHFVPQLCQIKNCILRWTIDRRIHTYPENLKSLTITV